jgi:hypothetical protein
VLTADKGLGAESTQNAQPNALELSTLDIILNAHRATTGSDLPSMGEIDRNGQNARTEFFRGNTKAIPGKFTGNSTNSI